MASSDTIHLTVAHRGTVHALSLPPDAMMADLCRQLEDLTLVAPTNQKLLLKGKRLGNLESTLADVGLNDGAKLQLLGPTAQELGAMKTEEDAHRRKQQILTERAKRGTPKVRSTASSSSENHQYRFNELRSLQHLPSPASALALLDRLASDPAIQHIMRTHKFSVGLLSELAPHEHPDLLGLNTNHGQQIQLRLRTNRYDGFRAYREVRRVLCHELAHNVHGDHDDDFKALNSRLNREVAEFEGAQVSGTHYLSDDVGEVYEPSAELEAEARAYVLGGGGGSGTPGSLAAGDDREGMRQRLLAATMRRLKKDEEELEESCGTAGPGPLAKP